jgi:type IV pilus assembly protein PilE
MRSNFIYASPAHFRCKSESWHAHFAYSGFTLIELMIVLVIVAVLAMVALPSFQKQMAKGRRADAISALSGVLQAQERWRSNRGTYASALENDLQLSTQSVNKHYDLSLSGVRIPASFTFGFIVQAVPVISSPQASDSDCIVMSIRVDGGNVSYEAKNSADQDSSAHCWPR